MFRAALRNLLAHKLRLALSALSIVLAVAFVAGTYIFTDSLAQSLNTVIRQDQPDVSVAPASAGFSRQFEGAQKTLTIPQSLVRKIEDLPQTSAAVAEVVVRNVVVLDANGEPIGKGRGFGGGTAVGRAWVTNDQLNPDEIVDGRPPDSPTSIVVDEATAEDLAASPGDKVKILLPSGDQRSFTLNGITSSSTTPGVGVNFVDWDLATAQKLLLDPGQVTSIAVLAKSGTTQDELKAAIDPLLPKGAEAVTGAEQASDISEQLDSGLGFLNTFLLVFAIVSLFVAAFLIYNTFSMLVAQRTRELALLRAIGASRAQITRSILVEAVFLAVVASVVGIVVGAGIARGLQILFQAAGAPFPATALVFEPRTVAVSVMVGVVITVLSALLPARRAARVPPVAAMRADTGGLAPGRRRTTFGAFLFGIGFGLAVMSPRLAEFDATKGAIMAGVAAGAILIATLMLAPELARPAVAALGWLFRGVNGRLARGNTRRNPRRTAATAGALTIGVCLMATISVLAASTQKSVAGIVDDVIGADFVVTGYGFQPFSTKVAPAIDGVPGVAQTAIVRQAPIRAPGPGDTLLTGVNPTTIQKALKLTVTEGSFDDLGRNAMALDSRTAEDIGAGLDTTIEVLSVVGPVKLHVVAIYDPAGGFNGYVTDLSTAKRFGATGQDSLVYVLKDPDADSAEVQQNIESALKAYPNVQVLDQSAFKASIGDQIGQLLSFLFALLFLAVLIALLGIVNTLALSVFERTREIGLLRAIGMSRAGIRHTIVIEAFIIAVFGAVLGMILGIAFGALLQRVLADQGIDKFALNPGQLAIFLALAAVGGVLAALWPAWRGSRLRILDAIAQD